MNEIATRVNDNNNSGVKLHLQMLELNNNTDNSIELLDNNSYKKNHNRVSVSSASSCHSDSSEDHLEGSRRPSIQDIDELDETKKAENVFKRFRSMSDGGSQQTPGEEPFQVFPSLPDSELEKMGLLGGDSLSERISEEELEDKFASLALLFAIDAGTVKDRCERQRRSRDQTENNLNVELDRLVEKTNRIQPLCIDAETTELMSALLAQIDIVKRAAALASISAERYGSVQHEDRLSESVSLMISHVNLLKKQRDFARKQLQYTKRVLQDSNSGETTSNPSNKIVKVKAPNGRLLNRRRASIATISQPQEPLKESRKISRRTSDLSLRATTSMLRGSRPSRLDFPTDLVKIKEGSIDELEPPPYQYDNPDQSDNESNHSEDSKYSSQCEERKEKHVDLSKLKPSQVIRERLKQLIRKTKDKYKQWTEDGTFHDICCFCAILCFSFSLIILVNIFIEIEFAKRGLNSSKHLWRDQEGPTILRRGCVRTT